MKPATSAKSDTESASECFI